MGREELRLPGDGVRRSRGCFYAAGCATVVLLLLYVLVALVFGGPLGVLYRSLTDIETTDEGDLVARRILAAVNQCAVEELAYHEGWAPGQVIDVEPCSLETLQERASTVPGWDRLVIIGAYAQGSVVADDPRLGGRILRAQVSAERGPLYDELCRVLSIEKDRIIANRVVTSFLYPEHSAVVVRENR